MSEKEIQRLKEWLTLKGKTETEVAECICYIISGVHITVSEEKKTKK